MTLITRTVFCSVVSRSTRNKLYSTSTPRFNAYAQEQQALQHHAKQTTELWRKISFYACIPGILTCIAWVYNVEAEHAAHTDHLKEESGGHLPEVPEYDYLNRRSKPYPWGMNTLFFNPHVNKNLEID